MTFPVQQVRASFPALAVNDDGVARTYLDNPAGTQVPRSVMDSITDVLVHSNSNSGMFNRTSVDMDARIDRLYASMATFFGSNDPGEVIIGPNMTSLTFHLSRCLAADFKPGDEIILSRMDHEGNIAPWLQIAEDHDLVVKWLPVNLETWRVEADALAPLLSDRTRLLAINYASNLTGSINDVKALTRMAKDAGALVYVDGVQYAPHYAIDVKEIGCDFFICSSYKFFGPHLGIAWGRREVLERLHPYKVRTAYNTLPDRLITGTQQMELLGGLQATFDYFVDFGRSEKLQADERTALCAAFHAFSQYEDVLARSLLDGLGQISGVTVHGLPANGNQPLRVPTIAFSHHKMASKEIARALSASNIFCHWSHNYALELTRAIGLDPEDGPVRLGIAHYNTAEEIMKTLEQLTIILE